MPTHLKFKVELQGARPSVWRRFLLHPLASFGELHDAIQVACGWDDSHLSQFFATRAWRDSIGGSPDGEDPEGNPVVDAHRVTLMSWFKNHKRCLYVYDFGDEWHHVVRFEGKVELADAFERKLLDGGRAFPPEDCGGIGGYERCVEIVSRPVAPDEDDDLSERREWLSTWDPNRFDLAATARAFDISAPGERTKAAKTTTITKKAPSAPHTQRSSFTDPLAQQIYDDNKLRALPPDQKLPAQVDEFVRAEAILTARTVRLIQRIDMVTQGASVDYRHLRMFLLTLDDTLVLIEACAEASPLHALHAYTHFVRRMPEAGRRVNDETEIRDFNEHLVERAFETMALVTSGEPTSQMFLSALLDAWTEDNCEQFGFLPERLVRQKLVKQDKSWLCAELDKGPAPKSKHKADEWLQLRNELGRASRKV
ncbi:MAG: plasmid pRiA4b ORF-3 family protein [Planctomycetota bacterium]|nr:plasmid pRiA4b ORF-3 family protein [Planctomycetota bacterium]